MDILIDLIVYLMKQATQSREAKAPPLTPAMAARQRAALQQQIMAMQQKVGAGRTGPMPAKGRLQARRPAAPPKIPLPALAPARAAQPVGPIPVVQRPHEATRSKMARSMRLPFILGEVLSAPVALREPEF